MLEMWGYSIGAARVGVAHDPLETIQLEPSSQADNEPLINSNEMIDHDPIDLILRNVCDTPSPVAARHGHPRQ